MNDETEEPIPEGGEQPSRVIVKRPDGTREVHALLGDKFQHLLKASELDNVDRSKPPLAIFRLKMFCVSRGASKDAIIKLWNIPETIFGLKEEIQKQFQIPYSFHTLCYKGKELGNDKKLRDVGLKNGDTLDVSYL